MPRTLQRLPTAQRQPATHPDRWQLYSFPTPKGVKVSMALEARVIPHEAHRLSIRDNQQSEACLSLHPNGKIPASINPRGSNGQRTALWESEATLLNPARKRGIFQPQTLQRPLATDQWLVFQMSGPGPMIGQ